jgi:dihydropteroate synthase
MQSTSESNFFSTKFTLNLHGRLLDLSVPKVMGVLNVTPDSFYDGGRFIGEKEVLRHAQRMLEEGADIIDIGGYSTRPGAEEIPVDEEKRRTLGAVKAIRKEFPDAALSIDTFRSEVAFACLQEGVALINDVSGGSLDEQMFKVVSNAKVPYILMHMRGTPQTMISQNQYENLNLDIIGWLQGRIDKLSSLGVKDIIIDPGIGFAKSIQQNFNIVNHLDVYRILDRPLLIGVSRKSLIWRTLKVTADQALNGTTVLNTVALMKGASILRVHDVKEAVETIKLYTKLKEELPV